MSPLAPITCTLLAFVARGAQLVDSALFMRREDHRGHDKRKQDPCLSSNPEITTRGFQLKSISKEKCLTVQEGETDLALVHCDSTDPKQRFQRADANNPDNTAWTELTTCNDDAPESEKLVCADLNTDSMRALLACDSAEAKNISFKQLSDTCFEMSAETHLQKCMEGTTFITAPSSYYVNFQGDCQTPETQWTSHTGKTKCAAVVTAGSDGLAGGAASEGGTGGQASSPVEAPLSTVGDEEREKVEETFEKEAEKAAEGDTIVNGEVVASPAPPPPPAEKTMRMILKYMGDGTAAGMIAHPTNRPGLCVKMAGVGDRTFDMATCDKNDPDQIFVAHGIDQIFKGGLPTYVKKITMGTTDADRILSRDGGTGTLGHELAGGTDASHESYVGVELIHSEGHCFKVQFPAYDGGALGTYKTEEACLKANDADGQELPSAECADTDTNWVIVPEDADYECCVGSCTGD